MWSFSRGLDISVCMINILIVMDNHTTWPDYFWSDFVGSHFNFFRKKFRARTAFTCLSLPVELMLKGNILLYNGALSFRVNEYLGLEDCATVTNGRFSFEIYIRMCCVDKNVNRLFWPQHKSCTERGTYIYPSAQKFQYIPSKEIIQKLLYDPQNEYVQVLSSQYLGKCTDRVTVLVRTVILINTDPKQIYIRAMT